MILALPVDNEQIHHETNGLFLWFEREQDPKGNLIRQWLSVDAFLGVVSKELNLSQNPPLGPWKIVAGINVSCVQTWVEDYFFDVSAYYAEKILHIRLFSEYKTLTFSFKHLFLRSCRMLYMRECSLWTTMVRFHKRCISFMIYVLSRHDMYSVYSAA